jgi:carbon-monoxide dehydrogenase medium subunit
MGTAVGNICSATPASDVASTLLALGAKLKIASAESESVVGLESFFVDVHKSILKPNELVTEIFVPPIPPGTGCAFLKLAKTRAEIAKLNVSVVATVADNTCKDAKIALGSVAPTPLRARKAEETIKGKKVEEEIITKTAKTAAGEATPITDLWSTVEYRTEMIEVLVKRAIRIALNSIAE